MEILTSVRRLYISFKSLVNDFVYSFGRAALLFLVEVQNHTVPVRERRRISLNSLNPASNGAPIDCTTSVHSTTVCECSPHFLSTPLRIKLQFVVCNVSHTDAIFTYYSGAICRTTMYLSTCAQ